METEPENTPTTTEKAYTRTALINASALGLFAIGTALILSLTYTGTKDRILESQRAAEEKALLEVIGAQPFDNNLLEDRIALSASQAKSLNVPVGTEIRVVRHAGEIQGFLFPAVAPDGYSGKMNMIIGIDTDGVLMGVRVVEHKETPGLGDKVDIQKSDWITSFVGKSLANPEPNGWAVTKDGGEFDAFTGATITPRAVVKMIRKTLELSASDQQTLIDSAQESLETEDG